MKKVNLLKSIGVLLVTVFVFVSCGKSKVLGTWNLESEDEDETLSYTFIDDGTVESVSDDTKYFGTYKYEKDVVTMSFTKEGTILASGAVEEYESFDQEYVEYGIIDNDEIFIGTEQISLPGENTVEGSYSWPGKRYTMFGSFDVTYTLTLTPYSDDDEKTEDFLGKAHLEEAIDTNGLIGTFTNEYNGDYTRRTVNKRDVLSALLASESGKVTILAGNIKNGFWYPFENSLKKQK